MSVNIVSKGGTVLSWSWPDRRCLGLQVGLEAARRLLVLFFAAVIGVVQFFNGQVSIVDKNGRPSIDVPP